MQAKKIKKIWNIVTTVLICIVALVAMALVGVKLFGVQVYTVLSGSMEPEFHTGSVIYVVQTDVDELEKGDIITFQLSGQTLATHRIIAVEGEGSNLSFRTKGDANEHEDASPVPASRVIGEAVFSIPLLGYLITYIQQPPGMYYAIVAGAILLLLMILPEVLFDDKKEQDDKKQKSEDQAQDPEATPNETEKENNAENNMKKEGIQNEENN